MPSCWNHTQVVPSCPDCNARPVMSNYGALPSNSASAAPVYANPTLGAWPTGLANQKPYAGPVSTPDPLAKEKAFLWDPAYGWVFSSRTLYHLRDKAGWGGIGVFTANRYAVYYRGHSGNGYVSFSAGHSGPTFSLHEQSFEVQLSDGSWYYPWTETSPDPGYEKEKKADYACQHRPTNVGFMGPTKWVCVHCDQELDTETAIKLGGKP